MNSSFARRWGAGIVGVCCFVAAAPTQAHGLSTRQTVVRILVLTDLAIAAGDIAAFANDARRSSWLVPQAIFTAPQALYVNAVTYTDPSTPVGVAMFADQLATFATYGMADRNISTTALYPLSWAIGSNLALTNNAVALALRSKLAPRGVAFTEIAASVPQLAIAGFALGSPGKVPSQRPELLALGAWSAALLTHGVLSLAFRDAAPECSLPAAHAEWSLTPGLIAADATERRAPGFVINGRF